MSTTTHEGTMRSISCFGVGATVREAAAEAARRDSRAAPHLKLLQGLEPLKPMSRSSFGLALAYAHFAAGKVGIGNVARAVAFPFDATEPARVGAPHRSVDARRVIEGGYDHTGLRLGSRVRRP